VKPVGRADLSPVADRLLVLQFVRVLIVVALLTVPAIAGVATGDVLVVAGVYLAFIAVVELVRRRAPGASTGLISWTVLLDGLAITVAIALSGGLRSPLLFLVFLDVMAVTLVASYRTGLKLALWCALLLLLAHAAVVAGVVDGHTGVSDRFAAVSAATFLLFASCTALFSAVNDRSLRHSRAQLESLVALGADLERADCSEAVTGALAHHACARLGFTRSAVLMKRGDGWVGTVDDGQVEMGVETPARSAPLVWETWASGAPMLVRLVDDDLLDLVLPGGQNVAVAPVAVDGENLGIAIGEWGGGKEARIPTATVHAFAQASMHTALALRSTELLSEVERLATRDSLTGLANRRLFDESLHRETARAERLGAPLSLVVLDVDHFKQVNDTYGHPTGDRVLCEVANALALNTKAFDVAARYGGDEFVVILPGCKRDDAVNVAQRVRSEIARQVGDAPVTVSAGVATIPDNAQDADRLIAAADAALYEAKRTGRDRVAASTRVGELKAPTALRSTPLARGA
jgi:diguanylate cyclase (GGDEF)-like protein